MSKRRLVIHLVSGYFLLVGLARLFLRIGLAVFAFQESGLAGIKAEIMREAFQLVDSLDSILGRDGFRDLSWEAALALQFFLVLFTAICGLVFFKTRRPKE